MKLSTTTTLFASLACLVSASAPAPPKASLQASIATAGNRAILALDNAKKAVSTFTDRVQATTNSLDIDPAVKEEFNTRFIILNRELEHSIFRVEGLVERFGSIHMKDDGETLRLNQDDSESPRINQDTPSRKLKKITDRISAMYKEYPDFDDMPEVYQTEMNALWEEFAEQMNHVGDLPLGSNDGRVYISSKSRIAKSSDKSDKTSCPFIKLWKRLTDRTFVFQGGEMLEKKKSKEQSKERHALVVELNKGMFSVSDGVAKRLGSHGVDETDEDDVLSKDELAQVQSELRKLAS
ncbi:hypothetical protein J4E86_002441 [Alternaria arbusti]|uniref:uncharacterized protein n=1 Tax=Alternaria arbusti TaxID=232088 RepID=UPI00221E3993|nr:uncharacterized protein J4E86_002441 [Alternaria arbusti]KAI4960816.1 hypothetical protein J4E86_002441 [Alternaria arbusti]